MAKQTLVKKTAAAAAPATPARAAKPKTTTRVKTAQHSKTVSPETAGVSAAAGDSEISSEAIAKMAYSYWESRGYQGGSPLEDWIRAEHEFQQR